MMVALCSLASSPPVSSPIHHGAEVSRKSAEIVKLHKRDISRDREMVRRLAPDTIRGAFPAPSQHQTCLEAHRLTGASPDTFERLLNGYTASPDLLLLVHVARIYAERTGKVSPLAALIAGLVTA